MAQGIKLNAAFARAGAEGFELAPDERERAARRTTVGSPARRRRIGSGLRDRLNAIC
jgi:hypothetical protein